MVSKVTIVVDGTRQIEAAMRELGVQAANRIARSALNRAATPVVRRAKELAPVDTGELRSKISKRLRRQRRGSSNQDILVGVEKQTSRRAHFAEYGTVHQAAHPFLRPALDSQAQVVLDVMTEAMKTGIEREIKKLAVRKK